jgi:RNA polymerase sigma-70 factor (ECF subfamily)
MTIDEQNACFAGWLNAHAAVLHHVANGFAEGADRHDLMQELLLAVWRAVPVFRSGARPSTFIYSVAHNAALTWKRTQRNYRRRVEKFERLANEPADREAGGSARERETLELIYREIRTLPPVDRSLVLLQLDGLSYAEIASIHGLTETNVGARLARLKQKISDALKEIVHELR